MNIKSALIYVLLLTTSFSCYSQKLLSGVEESTSSRIVNNLLHNKGTAKFPYIYEHLSAKSKIVKIFNAAVKTNDKASVSYNYDFVDNIQIGGGDYLVYNVTPDNGYEILGIYSALDTTDLNMYPALTIKETFLEDVKRYYNIDSVVFLALYGIPGYCILVNKEVWIIEGNERTDLKTYLKKYYPTLSELRNLFLLKS